MPPIEGVDYSATPPGAAALLAEGKRFVARYLSDDWRGLDFQDPGELTDLQANGIDIAVVYESTEQRPLDGEAAGIVDATYAQNKLLRLGLPPAQPIYFAADWDFAPNDQPAIDAYLRGAASVIGADRVGIYGGYWVVKRAFENGAAAWIWQTYAWSGGNLHPNAHLYQYDIFDESVGGTDVDLDQALIDNYGQASRFVAGPPSHPDPIPQPAVPVPRIPWGPRAVGPQDLHGTPALAFYAQTTALRNAPVHVGASKRSTVIAVIAAGATATIRGTFRNRQARWALIDLGEKGVGRAYLSAFAEHWPCPD